MSISYEDLQLLRLSPKASHQIGTLPESVADHFEWKSRLVCLSGERLEHILEERHGITEADVLLLPYALERGLLLQEKDRPDRLVACLQHPEAEGRRYKAAMKVLSSGFEIWVSTFHLTRPGQTKSLIDRSIILRDHQ